MVDRVTEVLARFFQPPDAPKWLIDVGVGMGREAHDCKDEWPQIKVVGLEPCTELRLGNADYQGILLPTGAWSHPRNHRINWKDNKEQASLFCNAPETMSHEHVILQPLDRIPELLGCDRAILWADCEGAELEVLRGSWRMLQRGAIDVLNLEVRQRPIHPGACTEAEVDSFLAAFGYAKALTWNIHRGDDPHWDGVWVKASRWRTW